MKHSELKQIKSFCESLHSNPDWREVVEEIEKGSNDFEIDNVRFIESDSIAEILKDELANDEYILGRFKAYAISEATGWPVALIEAAQKGEQFEEIGKAMTGEHVAELASIYASHDGYGHHFNVWDGSEETITINGTEYYVFDNH